MRIMSPFVMVCLWSSEAFAATVDPSGTEMTLWQTLVAGGMVMIVIGILSIIAGAIIIYDFWNLKVEKLTPRRFFQEVTRKLEEKNLKDARVMCLKENNNIIARIVLAGLDKLKKGQTDVKESVEHQARIEIGNLWQNLSYLSDIVAVAPLLGLLGTVLGMIQAFHAVPLQSAAVKTTLLAAGISKAMVATASSLIVAIPVLMAYSYFRGRVQQLTTVIEMYTTETIRMLEKL